MVFPPKPNYSKGQIDRAGFAARNNKPGSAAYEDAVEVINSWRVSHGYPMHTFNVTLRRKAKVIDDQVVVARRLKRLPTILDKLGGREPKMSLSRMQDVGGVRAIMRTVEQVRELRRVYTTKGRFAHRLRLVHDYIESPKASGYRGVHIVFEFRNSKGRTKKSRQYDGLNVEVQLRTELQHRWATAVETVGTIRHEALKSSLGDSKWLEFFQCMSSVIAQLEDCPVLDIHRDMTTRQLYMKTAQLAGQIDAMNVLAGWAVGARMISEDKKGSHYNILRLDVKEKVVYVYGFNEDKLVKANERLAVFEKQAALDGSPEPVLVAAGDINSLKRAYPNYFLDMKEFVKILKSVVKTVSEPL